MPTPPGAPGPDAAERAALALAARLAERLGAVRGVAAVTLGGSWSRGVALPDSDLDLGVYYVPELPLDIAALRELAAEVDDRHAPGLATDLGEWGPWINGGAWLTIEGRRVDWLYRDLSRVRAVIAECRAGRPTVHYQPGHPHGFHNHIYLAETHFTRPLYDPTGAIAELKALTTPYPPALMTALIRQFLWEAGFALETARKAADRGDVYYVSGCVFRSVSCLIQTLYALNEQYLMNEKGSTAAIEGFRLRPTGFAGKVTDLLGATGAVPDELRGTLRELEALVESVRELCGNEGTAAR